jgi:dipeptidyl aminopeptidase/acylaminoacyl peptidase
MKWLARVTVALVLVGTSLQAEEPVGDERKFLSNIRLLTPEGRRAGEGYFSPDGEHLIFQSEREPGNPFFQIYIRDFDAGKTHRVSPGVGKTTCAFFRPGSDDVLFASTHLDPHAKRKQEQQLADRAAGRRPRYSWDYDEHYDIFACRRDGRGLQRLTEAVGYDAEGAYSPDGRLIVFCSMRDQPPADQLSEEQKATLEQDPALFGEIYLMKADGTEPRRLTDWPGYDGGPFFSPDGKRIVWRHFEPGGRVAEVYTMKLDGSDRRRLTFLGCMSWAPYFHPSGEYVVFASNRPGGHKFDLFLVDAKGEKEPVRVTFHDAFDGLPVFSPDGKRLCWTSTRHDPSTRQGQLFLATWQHDAARDALRQAPGRSARVPPP